MTTSYDWIAHHGSTRPSRVAMVDVRSGRRFTYREMDERVDRLCAVLHTDFGVGAGERVAVLAQNTTEIFEVQFACWRLGAIFVPLNWRLAPAELDYIVGDCTPRVLVHDADFADVATGVAERGGISGASPGAAARTEQPSTRTHCAARPATSLGRRTRSRRC
jgi:fatty-acyl-CoA synthase